MQKTIIMTVMLLLAVCSYGQPAEFYHRYEDMVDKIYQWQDDFPDMVMVERLGYSQQDEVPVYAVKVSHNVQVNEDKPAILVIGSLHAEEILGNEIVMYHIERILDTPFMTPHSRWLRDLELWFIPNLNPEGLQVVMDGWDVTYRKNKRDNVGNGEFDFVPGMGNDLDGVDLNRNFAYNWVHGDTLWHPGGNEPYDYYRGPAPLSESETQALLTLLEEQHFVYSIIWHSSRSGNFSEKVYYSFNWYDSRPSPDLDIARSLAQGTASNILKFNSGQTYEFLPSLSRTGNAHDYFYIEHGNLQLMIECGTSNIQPQNFADMMQIVNENIKGQSWLFNRALDGHLERSPMLTGHIKDAVTGEPLQAEVIIEERHARYLKPRMSDELYGRYWRPLLAGIYTVTVTKPGYEPQTIEVAVNNSGWTIRNFNLEPLPAATFTGTLSLDNNPVDGEIKIRDMDESIVTVENGVFSIETYVGEKNLIVTADGSYPFIGSVSLQPGINQIDFNLGQEHIIFEETWEDNVDRWTIEGPWRRITEIALDGYAMTDSWGGGKNFYAPNTDVHITTDTKLNLTSYTEPEYQTPYLIFWQHLYTEWDHDFVYIQASFDGEEWMTLYQNSGQFDYWHPVYISLEDVVDEEFYLRFRLTSDSPDPRLVDPGWTLDNIKIVAGRAEMVSVEDNLFRPPTPQSVLLKQNYPNPFNPETTIAFSIDNVNYEQGEIRVYNIKGAIVERFSISESETNKGSVLWNATGRSSGIYLYQLVLDGEVFDTKRAVLLK